ncbi:MAG: AgmX/PglI C-terminal domain-containing protein [Deltaproteobacteria bacterium]|nr:AgmX/PglI C-terminal domain-containing protein [Deltaproteobacteria bacterium]
MPASITWRALGIAAAALLAAAACAKSAGSGSPGQGSSATPGAAATTPEPSLDDPARLPEALLELQEILDAKMRLAQPAARADAVGGLAARHTSALLSAWKTGKATPVVRERALGILVRTAPYTADPALRKQVVTEAFLPTLEAFRDGTEAPTPAARVVDALGALASPPLPGAPLLEAGLVQAVVERIADVAKAVRGSWACRERYVRVSGRTSAVGDEERLLLSCIDTTAKCLRAFPGADAEATGLHLLVDALRESPLWQHTSVTLAAVKALDRVGPKLTREGAILAAPALVEALLPRSEARPAQSAGVVDGESLPYAPSAEPEQAEAFPRHPLTEGTDNPYLQLMVVAPPAAGEDVELVIQEKPQEEDPLGRRNAEDVDRMAGVRGPRDQNNPHMARTEMLEQVARTGAVSALQDLRDLGASHGPFGAGAADSPAANDDPLPRLARQALVHLAATDEAHREVVLHELLRGLNVDPDGELAEALPDLPALGKNDRLELLGQPCGSTLGIACAEKEAALREFRDQARGPNRAACNRGADPDRPGSGFDWGLETGAIWSRLGEVLADVLPLVRPGKPLDSTPKAGLAVRALQAQVRLAVDWAAKVRTAERALDAAVEACPDLMSTREGAADGCDAAVLAAGGAAQTELKALADFDDDFQFQAVNERLWRSAAAARVLGLLGATGPGDETLRQVLQLAQFSLDHLNGFRITPLQAFPQLVLRFRARFAPSGGAVLPQPVFPALLSAVQYFQRPTPEVLNFLLHVMAASELAAENQNATIEAEKLSLVNADVVTFRALAARAFFAVFRHDPALPDADTYRRLFELYTGDVQILRALQKNTDRDPDFQLWPPIPRPAEGATAVTGEADQDWLAAPPPVPAFFTFDTYRDALAACVLPATEDNKPEDKRDRSKWLRELGDPQKLAYCRKWVEPWASESADESASQDIPRLQLKDSRCWTVMRTLHEDEYQFCDAVQKGRTPAKELGLTREHCDRVLEEDDTYMYCVDLRFAPEYLESGKPTLWGCYDRFPWLRGREPLGPACDHLASRVLAATMYVKLRSAAGVAAPDGVTFDRLESHMTLPELTVFAATFGTEQSQELFRKFDALVAELAKVQVDFPVFQRPGTDAAVATATVPKPEGVEGPRFVAQPWYRHDEWIARAPRDFSDLRATFEVLCRPEADPSASACAPDGGTLGNAMKLTVEGNAPGPLLEDAAGLAILLRRGDLVGVGELREALSDVDERCLAGGSYSADCLLEAVRASDGPPTVADLDRRVRALYLLAAMPDLGGEAVGGRLAELASAEDADPRFAGPLAFALRKLQPDCGPATEACERLRLGSFLLDDWNLADSAAGDAGRVLVVDDADFGRRGGRMGRGRSGSTGSAGGTSPDLRLGEATTFGGLSKEVIRRIVQQHRGRIRHCYEAALRTRPDLQGRVTVKFVIEPQGNVSTAEAVGNTTEDEALGQCIAAVVKRMSFPQADGITACSYPFMLQMVGPEDGGW